MYRALRVGFPILLIVLIILACGGVSSTPEVTGATETTESSPTAIPTPTYTPTPPLSAETYALRMESITLFPPEVEKIVEDLFRALYSPQTVVRLEALFSKGHWTEDDARFASEFAQNMLEVIEEQHVLARDAYMRVLDEVDSFTPPDFLVDAHNEVIETTRELLEVGSAVTERVVDQADTDIRNVEDLNEFSRMITVMEADYTLQEFAPDLAEQGDALDEQRYLACRNLASLLSNEIGRTVDIGICE